jgi:TATA-box binding protein (TBP) (component of TFIID and TFIIIB)
MKFRIRKLCSTTEEYEAMTDGPLDLDSLSVALTKHPGIEVGSCPPVLNILFEDKGVVVRLYSSGKALIQANMKEDVEHACSILAQAMEESINSNNTEMSSN